ncbi:MAG: PAS domain-containing protein, partial [Phycisphaerae bacterium]|nr:PAS domain-containing protein [Phycisphaerae bacterium]
MQEALEFLTREELLEEIRRQHAYKQTVESAGSVGVWEANLKTGVGLWSTEKRRLHGWERHDETPTTMNSILRHVHPDDRAYLQDVFTTKYKQGDSITYTYRIDLPNGEIRWLSSRGKVLAAEDGIATKILGVTLDVTENKRVEQQLQELNQALVQRTQEANHRAAQLQLLATQITQIENRERRRLALLLHDHLQQILIGCRMKMGQLKLLCQSAGLSPNASYAELLTQTTELVNEAIRASRSL